MICRKLGTFSDASLPASAVNNIKVEGRGELVGCCRMEGLRTIF